AALKVDDGVLKVTCVGLRRPQTVPTTQLDASHQVVIVRLTRHHRQIATVLPDIACVMVSPLFESGRIIVSELIDPEQIVVSILLDGSRLPFAVMLNNRASIDAG